MKDVQSLKTAEGSRASGLIVGQQVWHAPSGQFCRVEQSVVYGFCGMAIVAVRKAVQSGAPLKSGDGYFRRMVPTRDLEVSA